MPCWRLADVVLLSGGGNGKLMLIMVLLPGGGNWKLMLILVLLIVAWISGAGCRSLGTNARISRRLSRDCWGVLICWFCWFLLILLVAFPGWASGYGVDMTHGDTCEFDWKPWSWCHNKECPKIGLFYPILSWIDVHLLHKIVSTNTSPKLTIVYRESWKSVGFG